MPITTKARDDVLCHAIVLVLLIEVTEGRIIADPKILIIQIAA